MKSSHSCWSCAFGCSCGISGQFKVMCLAGLRTPHATRSNVPMVPSADAYAECYQRALVARVRPLGKGTLCASCTAQT